MSAPEGLVPATLIRAGVGLPAHWRGQLAETEARRSAVLFLGEGEGEGEGEATNEAWVLHLEDFLCREVGEVGMVDLNGLYYDLTDRASEFAVALRLDAWERASAESRGGCWPSDYWAEEAARRRARRTKELVERLTEIGMDYTIRRLRRWEIAPPLMEVRWHPALAAWMLKHPSIPTHDNAWTFGEGRSLNLAVAGAVARRTPREALALAYSATLAEVASE